MANGSGYAVEQLLVEDLTVLQLRDGTHQSEVLIAPEIGNMAYRFRSHGDDLLWFPFTSLADLKVLPRLCGVPFLGPWANRLDGDAYWVNNRRYRLNADMGNVRRDAHQNPIHGLLNFTPYWKPAASGADDDSAWSTSRLEFWRHPDLMAQFPFAHTLEMTHRLSGGNLTVETRIENLGLEPLPVAVGHHPYFRLPGVPRDEWQVHLAARDHLQLSDLLIPTGAKQPMEFPDPFPLAGAILDDVFGNLVRDADGRARFWVQGGGKQITVTYGPNYNVAIVYAPAGQEYICFEPMSAVTNAFNLAHAGVYHDLQSVAPGEVWAETFEVRYSLVG